MPAPQRATGNPNAHAQVDLQKFTEHGFHHAAGLSSIAQHAGEEEDSALERGTKQDAQLRGEAASVVFGGAPPVEQKAHKSIAGLTLGQVHQKKKSGYEARRLDVRTMRDPGGSEAHDVMYAKKTEDIEYDGNEEPRIDEIPEKYPENYTGAAGLPTKEVFRQQTRPFMFGEKTSDGMEYGAKHISALDAGANPAQLNSAFMQSSHWFEPDDSTGAGRTRQFTAEEIEQSMAAADLAEESRRHALYQSYASFGAASGYGEDGAAGDAYEWQAETAPKWARSHPEPPPEPPTMPPRSPPPQQHPSQQPGSRGTPRSQAHGRETFPGSPVDRLPPGAAHRKSMQGSAGGMRMPTGGPTDAPPSSFRGAPQLFEKGSFAHRKLEATSSAFGNNDGPLSGRSSARSPGRMGQYADFASRLHAADSQRSQRSARSYRG